MTVRFLNPPCLDGGREQKRVLELQEEWIEEMKNGKVQDSLKPLDESCTTDENTLVLFPNDKSDVVVGYLVFFPRKDPDGTYQDPGDAYQGGNYEIYSLFISESFRDSDGGTSLMEGAAKHIKKKGGKRIELCLMTSKKNECRLIKFYKKLGYGRCSPEGEKYMMEKLLG